MQNCDKYCVLGPKKVITQQQQNKKIKHKTLDGAYRTHGRYVSLHHRVN